MIRECTAILVSTQDNKECDKIIQLLSAEEGLIYAHLRGVRKPNARLKAAGQMFAFGRYCLSNKGNVVTSFVSLHEFDWIVGNYDTFVSASIGLEATSMLAYGGDSLVLLPVLLSFLRDMLVGHNHKSLHSMLSTLLSVSGYHRDYSNYGLFALIDEIEHKVGRSIKSAKLLVV